MRLPTSLTTVTPLSKALALFLFITLPLLFFIIGMDFGRYGKQLEIENSTQTKIRQLQEQLKRYDAELNDIINNRGTVSKQYNSPYNDRDFGLYSKLFENKQMKVTVYKYKRTLITQREIEIEPDISAITWTYELIPPNRTLSRVTFDGYENYSLYAYPINDHNSIGTKEIPYISNNRNLYWDYIYRSKALTSIYLEGLINNTTTGKEIFLRLEGNIDNSAFLSSSEVIDYKKHKKTKDMETKLINIANQIPYRKTN